MSIDNPTLTPDTQVKSEVTQTTPKEEKKEVTIPDKFKKADGTLDVEKALGSYLNLEKEYGRIQGEVYQLKSEKAKITIEPAPVAETKKDVVEMTSDDLDVRIEAGVRKVIDEITSVKTAGEILLNIYGADAVLKEIYKDDPQPIQFDKDVADICSEKKFLENYSIEDAIKMSVSEIKARAIDKAKAETPNPKVSPEVKVEYVSPQGKTEIPAVVGSKAKELFEEGKRTGNMTAYLEYVGKHPNERIVSELSRSRVD